MLSMIFIKQAQIEWDYPVVLTPRRTEKSDFALIIVDSMQLWYEIYTIFYEWMNAFTSSVTYKFSQH